MLWGIFAILLVLWYFSKPIKLYTVPGPKGWPLIGNVTNLDLEKSHVPAKEWAQKYGNVVKLTIVGKPVIIVSGTDALNEMFAERGADFASRPSLYRMDLMSFDGSDVAFAKYNDEWKIKRKILFHGLKQHNLKNIETITQNILSDLISDIQELDGKPIDPTNMVEDCFIQILYVMVFNSFIEKGDLEVETIKTIFNDITDSISFIGSGVMLDVFPFLRFFGNGIYKKLMRIRNKVKELDITWRRKISIGDIQDCWFKEMLENQKQSGITDETVVMLAMDFFIAGFATSSYTILTLLNVLTHYPDVQEKMHKEIDRVVGLDRRVAFADRYDMPYTRACIFEVLRYQTVVPMGLPHITTADTKLGGHDIPKDTMVLTSLWAQHHDPRIWPDPDTFNPERFLTEDGQLVLAGESPRKDLFPFGGGPRLCAGETLALTRLFLFISNIGQKFTVLPRTTVDKQTSIHPIHGFTTGAGNLPKPYKVRMVPRH